MGWQRNVGRASIISFATGAIFWFLSTVVPFQWLSILLFGLSWIPIGATNILFATISQIVIPNQYIGRINSVMRSMGTIAMPIGSLIGGYAANVFSSQLILRSLASGFYLFLSYGYFIRNYGHCRKLMKLQRILLVFGLRKSAGKVRLYSRNEST